MVRVKAHARRPLVAHSDPSTSGRSPDLSSNSGSEDLFLGKMAKGRKSSFVTELGIQKSSRGMVLSTPDGRWIDTEFFFVEKDPEVPQEFYYRDLTFGYARKREAFIRILR